MSEIRNKCAVFDCRKDSVTNFGQEMRGLYVTLWLCEIHRKMYEGAPRLELTPCKACGWALHKPSDGKCQRCEATQ